MTTGAAGDGGPRFVPRRWVLPAAIVLVALVVRVAAVAVDSGYAPINDSGDYDRHARSMAASFSYPPPIPAIAPSGGPSAFRGRAVE